MPEVGAVDRREGLPDDLPDELFDPLAGQLECAVVDEGVAPLPVEQEHAVAHVGEERGERLVAALFCLGRAPLLGNVLDRPGQSCGDAVDKEGLTYLPHPALLAIGGTNDAMGGAVQAVSCRVDRPGKGSLCEAQVIGMHAGQVGFASEGLIRSKSHDLPQPLVPDDRVCGQVVVAERPKPAASWARRRSRSVSRSAASARLRRKTWTTVGARLSTRSRSRLV